MLSSEPIAVLPVPARPGRWHAAWTLLAGLLSFRVMLACGLVVVAVGTVGTRFSDPDLWWHLKMGQVLWTTHSIPPTDTFSYTVYGHAWIPHEWLAQLTIYAAYHWGGYVGLMLWLSVLASVLLVLGYCLAYLHSHDPLVAFLGGLCVWFFATVGMAIRPQLLGYTFLLIELMVLAKAPRHRRWLWLLPPLFAVWVNCHGSFFFGMGVLVIQWLSAHVNRTWGLIVSEAWDAPARKLLGAVALLSMLALCCNPVGIKLPLYPLDVAFHQSASLNGIDEWLPPDLGSPRGVGVLITFFVILIVPPLRRAELRVSDLLTAAFGLALAARHCRMLFVFGIAVVPAFSRALGGIIGRGEKRDQPVANAVLIALFIAVFIWAFPSSAAIDGQIRKGNPVGAVDYIRRAGLSGPMLNDYRFGDYLIWALPDHKVFIDGRGDIFDWSGVLTEYGKWASLSEDPAALLTKYKIRFCLLAANARMAWVIRLLPGWKQAYADDVAVVFVKG